jgi:fructose-1,6-bisphosphatase/inositol monophosphatase family enzyme
MPLTSIEESALEAFRRGDFPPKPTGDERSDWISSGLSVAFQAARLLRNHGPNVDVQEVNLKSDGSPVTELDREVEAMVRAALAAFHPETAVIGEEGGGELPATGPAVAIDPVDGTWAYISGTGTAATTLAVFEDGVPFLGVVANPTTGEVAYAVGGGEARLIQLAVFGEPDAAHRLPLGGADPAKLLVNVQPNLKAQATITALFEAWDRRNIQYVRSPGGSPAWALLEAAKGRFSYINLWSDRSAEAYDLAAGVLLVRAAGGDVIGLDGKPIDLVHHAGPFVAGIQANARSTLLEIVAGAI